MTGEFCEETVIDYCVPDPCKNGAGCESVTNGYTCNCLPLYTGMYCYKTQFNFRNGYTCSYMDTFN